MLGKQKTFGENDVCRYCRFATATEDAQLYRCKRYGEVKASHVCKHYAFNPMAPRVPRPRMMDTSLLDPLDFSLED